MARCSFIQRSPPVGKLQGPKIPLIPRCNFFRFSFFSASLRVPRSTLCSQPIQMPQRDRASMSGSLAGYRTGKVRISCLKGAMGLPVVHRYLPMSQLSAPTRLPLLHQPAMRATPFPPPPSLSFNDLISQQCSGKTYQNAYRCARTSRHIPNLNVSCVYILTTHQARDYTCCPNFDLACSPGRECCGGFCCQEGQVCSSAATCVVRASSTAGLRSATSSRTGTSATGASTTQVSGGGAEAGAEGDGPKKGFSQSDKIALGCGIGIGLPTLLVAILTLWNKCT